MTATTTATAKLKLWGRAPPKYIVRSSMVANHRQGPSTGEESQILAYFKHEANITKWYQSAPNLFPWPYYWRTSIFSDWSRMQATGLVLQVTIHADSAEKEKQCKRSFEIALKTETWYTTALRSTAWVVPGRICPVPERTSHRMDIIGLEWSGEISPELEPTLHSTWTGSLPE